MTVYMGQIMAECDCTHPACDQRGYCMAARIEELEAKLAKALWWFYEIRQHCTNSGQGVPSIDERIIERCEDTAASAIAELKGEANE